MDSHFSLRENPFLKEILEDAPENIWKLTEETLVYYHDHKDDKKAAGIASDKLRHLYYTISQYLLETKLQHLTSLQKLFINTGGLAEKVEIFQEGTKKIVELLPEKTLSSLEKEFYLPESEPLAKKILTVYGRWEALAQETLFPLSQSGEVKKTKEKTSSGFLKTAQKQTAAVTTYKLQASQKLEEIELLFHSFLDILNAPELHNMGKEFHFCRLYLGSLQEDPKKALDLLKRRLPQLEPYRTLLNKLQNTINSLAQAIQTFDHLFHQLVTTHLSLVEEVPSSEEKAPVIFHKEALRNIKWDNDALTPFVVKGAQSSPYKAPFGDARILVKETLTLEKEHWLTPLQLLKSLKKLCSIHVNLFPKSATGEPLLPPFCIEPIYDYVEWFGDRLVLSFLAPPLVRKGPKVSFSAVDLHLLRGFGLILAQDPIFDYRGEINTGTFMGDYAGKVEKKAQVKWTGPQKKATMVMSSKMVDQASREEAVRDYIDFVYAMVNGFPPPPRLSPRKIGIFFKYVLLYDIEFSAQLLLQHLSLSDPYSARDTLLHYSNKITREAIALAKKSYQNSPYLQKQFQNSEELFLQKIFGKGTLE